MTTNRKRLEATGMHPAKIREVESWIKSNKKVIVNKDRNNGITDIFCNDDETGSLIVLEL